MMTPKRRSELCADISQTSRQLMLSSRFAETCMQEGTQKQLEFILSLLQGELSLRAENRISRLLRRAGFPVLKTFETYDSSGVRFPDGFSQEMICDCSFIREKTNLVLYGPVGTGKTHMAIAAGVNACRAGLSTRFFTTAALVRQLCEASRKQTVDKFLRDLRALDLLILDEWGYVPIDREGAQLLFQVICESYESKSLILTTNLEFSRWGTILTDEQMAAAVIDRLAHHGRLLVFEGTSYRMEHALMRQPSYSVS